MRLLPLSLALLLTLCLTASVPARQSAQSDQNFAGKILLVFSDGEQKHIYVVQATAQQLGGKGFITGQLYDPTTAAAVEGVHVWLPIEAIQRIVTFKDQEALKSQMDRQR